jgi:hypothetical protein
LLPRSVFCGGSVDDLDAGVGEVGEVACVNSPKDSFSLPPVCVETGLPVDVPWSPALVVVADDAAADSALE